MATASNSLFNMTVASDNAGGNQGLLMPKLQYRFRINFLNFGVDVDGGLSLTKQVMSASRPNVSFDEIVLNVYNSRIYLPGKHAWQPIDVTIRDDANGAVAKAVGQQMQKQFDFVEQASAAAGQDFKFQTNLQILDGGNGTATPVVLENWELYGCYLASANYQTLDYAANDPATIQLSIRFDNAVQTQGDTLGTAGIGQRVGRIIADAANQGIATGVGANTPTI